ncbi:class I SAM-dependent methyltransferase [Rhodospirillaceae bacterium KN72]|uniref:Class I SAM-dependent methyltransferase n=1 Tax=Pacificispira spongiicola TaxID=2729598 RepID=A0A7Y0E342_9PROT|nr:class I SAM-dependent methyltransferase [Pacificispira spongiicola]NMM46334.1 class I SAM-dependent methyltransferase [Pacificispira spongiicola]
MAGYDGISCPVTGATDWFLIKSYNAPPTGETDFGLSPYRRDLLQSPSTGHVVNRHDMDLSDLYSGDYWNRTYGGGRMAAMFDKIMALPPERSDNRGRVAFVDGHCGDMRKAGRNKLLDVGAGLAVFPAAMRQAGWHATALDPDPRSAEHARSKADVDGLVADFMTDTIDRRFDLVTFNKVLEHVPDPVTMLAKSRDVLTDCGVVYVELPDGEAALADAGPDREEFFIEHYCAFSAVSYAMLARRAGFRLMLLDRLVEPSGKYTLRGLMRPEPAA